MMGVIRYLSIKDGVIYLYTYAEGQLVIPIPSIIIHLLATYK